MFDNSIRRGGRVLQEKPGHLAVGWAKSAMHDESLVGSAPSEREGRMPGVPDHIDRFGGPIGVWLLFTGATGRLRKR